MSIKSALAPSKPNMEVRDYEAGVVENNTSKLSEQNEREHCQGYVNRNRYSFKVKDVICFCRFMRRFRSKKKEVRWKNVMRASNIILSDAVLFLRRNTRTLNRLQSQPLQQ